MVRSYRVMPVVAWAYVGYLATALVGVWAAYDRETAWSRFGSLSLGTMLAIGIGWAGARGRDRARGLMSLGCALLTALLAAYFLLTFDWSAQGTAKFSALQSGGLWIQTHRPAGLPNDGIQPNAVGGALSLLLPFGLAGVGWARARCSLTVVPLAALGVAVGLLALVLTASRGAWLGLAAGGLAVGYCRWKAHFGGTSASSRRLPNWLDDAALGVVALGLTVGFLAVTTWPDFETAVRALSGSAGESVVSRARLWRDVPALIEDYAFTGSGLGATEMVYSSYSLLVHVGYLSHAHNLFLQMAVEQGLVGLIAFLWLAASGVRGLIRRQVGRAWSWDLRSAAVASLVALVVHGMVDSQLYVSRLVPIMFLPLGFGLALIGGRAESQPKCKPALSPRDRRPGAIVAGGLPVLALAALLLPGPRAAFLANLGAVAQSRAELSVYRWPEWSIQDAVRRSQRVDLGPSVASYQAALALAPSNATANRRLGQIELSRGEFEVAQRHLELAYQVAPYERATRQLLGESYAVAGAVEQAAALWSTVDGSQGQLEIRQWWYAQQGQEGQARSLGQARALAQRARAGV